VAYRHLFEPIVVRGWGVTAAKELNKSRDKGGSLTLSAQISGNRFSREAEVTHDRA
jgi:hypothetical protein